MLAGAIASGPYTYLPGLVDGVVSRDLQARMGLSEPPRVKLRSDPPYAMLGGRFSSGTIEMEGAAFGNIHTRRIRVRLGSFELDVLRSLVSGRLVSREPMKGSVKITLSEDEVKRMAVSEVRAVSIKSLALRPGRVEIGSEAVLAGVSVPVSVVGSVAVRDGGIVFSPTRVSAFGLSLPRVVNDAILSGISFFYPIRNLPFPIRLDGVEVRTGRAVLRGTITIPSG